MAMVTRPAISTGLCYPSLLFREASGRNAKSQTVRRCRDVGDDLIPGCLRSGSSL